LRASSKGQARDSRAAARSAGEVDMIGLSVRILCSLGSERIPVNHGLYECNHAQ
jgi:hypothetical protein